WQDAEWTHDMTSLVPADAVGIEWATLWIDAWDVDGVDGEEDIVYANGPGGVELGALTDTGGRYWGTSQFTLPPSLLDELWLDGQLDVFVDIDAENTGQRVTLGPSTLRVAYTVPEPATIGLLGLGGLLLLKRRRS
ncbi:MAG: PEP-CTERM sorting domain-containing protein, partial [Planctomycetota bacterium]